MQFLIPVVAVFFILMLLCEFFYDQGRYGNHLENGGHMPYDPILSGSTMDWAMKHTKTMYGLYITMAILFFSAVQVYIWQLPSEKCGGAYLDLCIRVSGWFGGLPTWWGNALIFFACTVPAGLIVFGISSKIHYFGTVTWCLIAGIWMSLMFKTGLNFYDMTIESGFFGFIAKCIGWFWVFCCSMWGMFVCAIWDRCELCHCYESEHEVLQRYKGKIVEEEEYSSEQGAYRGSRSTWTENGYGERTSSVRTTDYYDTDHYVTKTKKQENLEWLRCGHCGYEWENLKDYTILSREKKYTGTTRANI